jgi:hypothetical protein
VVDRAGVGEESGFYAEVARGVDLEGIFGTGVGVGVGGKEGRVVLGLNQERVWVELRPGEGDRVRASCRGERETSKAILQTLQMLAERD